MAKIADMEREMIEFHETILADQLAKALIHYGLDAEEITDELLDRFAEYLEPKITKAVENVLWAELDEGALAFIEEKMTEKVE